MSYEPRPDVLWEYSVQGTSQTLNVGATIYISAFGDSYSFTKLRDDTNILLQIDASCYANSVSSCQWGVNLGGTDLWCVGQMWFNETLDHRYWSSACQTTWAAGTYTVQGRWRHTAGGSAMNFNSDDVFSVTLEEIVNNRA